MTVSRAAFRSVVIGLPVLALVIWVAWSVPPWGGAIGYAMVALGALAMVAVIVSSVARVVGVQLPGLGEPRRYRLLAVLGGAAVLTVIGWSSIYLHLDVVHPSGAAACFAPITGWRGRPVPAHVGHWGSFYYTMGTFTTAGTGDLAAASSTCQALTSVQLLEDVMLVATTISLASTWVSTAAVNLRQSHQPKPPE